MTVFTWHMAVGDRDPIIGHPYQYEGFSEQFARVRTAVSRLGDDFVQVRHGGASFTGQAADAFRGRLEQIETALRDVPDICRQVEIIFRDHADRLRALHVEADQALARAQTNWHAANDAREDHREAVGRLSVIERQLDSLSSVDEAQVLHWTNERERAERREDVARRNLDHAEDRLDNARDDWNALRDREDDLDQETADRLRGVDLWSLEDPGLFEAFFDYVTSWDFVLDLYDALGDVLMVLGVVALVLAFFVPGLYAIVAVVIAVLAVTKAVLSVAVWASGRREGFGFGNVLLDFVGAILAVVGAGEALKVLKVTDLTRLHVPSGQARSFVERSHEVGKLLKSSRITDAGRLTTRQYYVRPAFHKAVDGADAFLLGWDIGAAREPSAPPVARDRRQATEPANAGSRWTSPLPGRLVPITGGSDGRRSSTTASDRLVCTGW